MKDAIPAEAILSIPFRILPSLHHNVPVAPVPFQFLLGFCVRATLGRRRRGRTLSIPFRILRHRRSTQTSTLKLSIPFRILPVLARRLREAAERTFNSF